MMDLKEGRCQLRVHWSSDAHAHLVVHPSNRLGYPDSSPLSVGQDSQHVPFGEEELRYEDAKLALGGTRSAPGV